VPTAGSHVLCDVKGCPPDRLNNDEMLAFFACEAAEEAGATIIDVMVHRFTPQGVTILLLLAESHLSIHTWPELGQAAIDVYTCGDVADPDVAVVHLIQALDATHFGLHRIERPLPVKPVHRPRSFLNRLFDSWRR
jgi:S-adenosylmethionine decarboxylase proenzyme